MCVWLNLFSAGRLIRQPTAGRLLIFNRAAGHCRETVTGIRFQPLFRDKGDKNIDQHNIYVGYA